MSEAIMTLEMRQQQISDRVRNKISKAEALIDNRQWSIYQNLVFNNILDTLNGIFPILRSVLTVDFWDGLVRDFVRDHVCQSPLFQEMATEFYAYLNAEREGEHDPAILIELAHYEWLDWQLTIACPDTRTVGKDVIDKPRLTPVLQLQAYHFPVHQQTNHYVPIIASDTPYYLVAYRNLAEKVFFVEINALAANLLLLLSQPECCSSEWMLKRLIEHFSEAKPDVVRSEALKMLTQFKQLGIILGD